MGLTEAGIKSYFVFEGHLGESSRIRVMLKTRASAHQAMRQCPNECASVHGLQIDFI